MDIRITNGTRQDLIVASIKQGTFRFFAASSEHGKLKQRGIFGSYIEFEYYTSNGFTVDYGDRLNVSEFVNVDKSFNDIYPSSRAVNMFPQFYVKEIKSRKNAVYVSAYDCASFLDVDYSQRLVSLQNSFPMTIGDLFDDVMQFAGLTTRMIDITYNWPAGQSIAASTINYFYSNGIFARDIVNYISEMMGIGFRASSSTSLIQVNYQDSGNITAWLNVDEYVVCPDDGTYYQEDGVTQAVNIWYKENGLSISSVIFAYDGVEIISNDGQIVGSYYNVTPAQNIYKIYNNVIIGNVNTYDSYIINANEIAKLIYLQMSSAYPYVSATVSIFPFRNPYRIGTTARIIAPDGNYYNLPIMSLEITASGVVIESFGSSSEYNTNDGGEDRSLALDVRVTALESESEQKGSDLLLSQLNVPATATSYACDWANYDILIINGMFYGNTVSSYVVTKDYFNGTTSGGRVMVIDPVNSNRRYAVYKKDNENIYALTESGTPGAAYGIRIYGVKL